MGIAGMLRSKNLSLVSFAANSPAVRVANFERVPATCDMTIDSVTLEREDVEGVLLGRVVANLKGHVNAIRSGSIPGHEGELVEMAFDERKTYDSDDDFVSAGETDDVALTVNNEAPVYVLRNVFTFDESYLVGAKGGFVPGYADGAIPDQLLGAVLRDMPMELNLTEFMFPSGHGDEVSYEARDALFALDIVDQYGYEVTSVQTGYNVAEMLNVDKTMMEHPQNTVDTVVREVEDSDEYMRADVSADELLASLEAENELLEDVPDVEADIEAADEVDAEAEAAANTVDASVIANAGYDHDKVVGMFASDKRTTDGIFGKLFDGIGEGADELAEHEHEGEGLSGLNDDESRARNNQRMMQADMQLAGSTSIADAQQNVEELDMGNTAIADMLASDDEIGFL